MLKTRTSVNKERRNDTDIGVLHGFRVIFIFLVANFHIWQQSWMTHQVTIFGKHLSFDFVPRSGYIFVDGMILISAFLLALPYVRDQQIFTIKTPSIPVFYGRKVARILPSYLLNVLFIFFAIALPQDLYSSSSRAAIDLLSHLSLTQTFSYSTYFASLLNSGLWTIVIIMQGYLIMPFVLRFMQKRPILVLVGLSAIGLISRFVIYHRAPVLGMWLNQLPAFLDVYAIGFLGAIIFVRLEKTYQARPEKWWHKTLCTIILIVSSILIVSLQKYQSIKSGDELKLTQLKIRLPLTILLMILILTAAFSFKGIKFLLSNRLMRFLASISYNFYIWHQLLAVQMRLAFYDTQELHSTLRMQQGFTLLCYSVAILVSAFLTFYFEKPMANLINRKMA